jgi:hypothetical protein
MLLPSARAEFIRRTPQTPLEFNRLYGLASGTFELRDSLHFIGTERLARRGGIRSRYGAEAVPVRKEAMMIALHHWQNQQLAVGSRSPKRSPRKCLALRPGRKS